MKIKKYLPLIGFLLLSLVFSVCWMFCCAKEYHGIYHAGKTVTSASIFDWKAKNGNVEITDIPSGENGFYNPSTNTITLNSNLPAGKVPSPFAFRFRRAARTKVLDETGKKCFIMERKVYCPGGVPS